MKNWPIVAILMCICQISRGQITPWSIVYGVDRSAISVSSTNSNFNESSSSGISGHQFGFLFTHTLFKHFGIQSGLLFTQRGGSYNSVDTYIDGTGSSVFMGSTQIKISYLKVPLNLYYYFPLKFGRAFVGLGAYTAAALSASRTVNGTETYNTFNGMPGPFNNSYTTPISSSGGVQFGNMAGQLTSGDAGLTTTLGIVLLKRVTMSVSGEYGLNNFCNLDGVSYTNRAANLYLAYTF